MKSSRSRFAGYRILIARALYLTLQWGAFKSYGVLLEATAQSIPHSIVTFAYSIPGAIVFLLVPVSRRLIDVFPVRYTCIFGGFIAGVGYILSAILETSVVNIITGCSISGIGFSLQIFPSVVCLLEHYGKQFKKYQSIPVPFMFVGSSIMPVFLERMMQSYGQKGATLIFGGLIFHSMIVGLLLSRGPYKQKRVDIKANTRLSSVASDESEETGQEGNANNGSDIRVPTKVFNESENTSLIKDECKLESQSIKLKLLHIFYCHPQFILTLYAFGATYFIYGGWCIFLVPFAQMKGYELSEAVYFSTFGGLGGLTGMILACVLLFYDWPIWTLLVFPSSVAALTLVLSVFYVEYWYLALSAFVSGFCLGIVHTTNDGCIQESVCLDHLTLALMYSYFVAAPSVLFSGLLGGFLRERTGNYDLVFLIYAGVFATTACALLVARFCIKERDSECET